MRRRMVGSSLMLVVMVTQLAAASIASRAAATTSVPTFVDVPADHPFSAPIGWLAAQGVTTGYGDGSFHPAGHVTRQAMAAFFQRYDQATVDGPDAHFVDVAPDHPFAGAIWWLADAKITTGYPDDTFRPGNDITRQAMAAFFYRLAGQPDGPHPTCNHAAFADVPVDHPFCGEIAWLATSGITTGYADGFRPGAPITRQAVAAFFWRWAGSPASDSPGVNRVDPAAVSVLPGDQVPAATVSADGDGISALTLAAGTSPPAIGAKVVMDATDAVPTGVLGEVIGTAPGPGGSTVVTLAPLPVSQILDQWDVRGSTHLDRGTVHVDHGHADAFGGTFDVDCGLGGDLSIDVDLDPQLDLNVHASGGPFEDDVLEITATLTLDWSIDTTLAGGAKCTASFSFPDPEIPLGVIPLPGPLPPIRPSLEFFAEASAGIATSFTVHLGERDTYTVGARWINGVTTPVTEATQALSAGGFDTNPIYGEAEAFAGARINLYLAGLAGGYLKVGPYANAKIQPFDQPWGTVDGGVRLSVGLGVDLWFAEADVTLANLNFAPHHYADTGADEWPGPTLVTTELTPGIAGSEYHAPLDVSGGTPPYTWQITGLPGGLEWDESTHTVHAASAPATDTDLTVTVVDAAGWTTSKQMHLRIDATVHLGGGIGPPDQIQSPVGFSPPDDLTVLPSGRLWVTSKWRDWVGLADADGTLRWWSDYLTTASVAEDGAGNVYLTSSGGRADGAALIASISSDGGIRWQSVVQPQGYEATDTEPVAGGPLLDEADGQLVVPLNTADTRGQTIQRHFRLVKVDLATGALAADVDHVDLGWVERIRAVHDGFQLVGTTDRCQVSKLNQAGESVWVHAWTNECQGSGSWAAFASDESIYLTDLVLPGEAVPASTPLRKLDADGSTAWTVDVPTPANALTDSCPVSALPNGDVLLNCPSDIPGAYVHQRSAADGSTVEAIAAGWVDMIDQNGLYFDASPAVLDDNIGPGAEGVEAFNPTASGATPASSPVRVITVEEAQTGLNPYVFAASVVATGDGLAYVRYLAFSGRGSGVAVVVAPTATRSYQPCTGASPCSK